MTFFQLSILANLILSVIIIIFAIDRASFQKTCRLRHNPIDAAIVRIEETLNRLHDMFVEHIKGDRK